VPPGLAATSPARPPVNASGTSAGQPTPVVEAPDLLKDKLASDGLALTGTLLGHGLSFVVSASAMLILLYFLLASEHWMLLRVFKPPKATSSARGSSAGGSASAPARFSCRSCSGVGFWALPGR